MNTQDWSPLGWTGRISLQSKGLPRLFNTTVQKHQFFGAQPSSRFDLTVLKLQIIVDNNIYEYYLLWAIYGSYVARIMKEAVDTHK